VANFMLATVLLMDIKTSPESSFNNEYMVCECDLSFRIVYMDVNVIFRPKTHGREDVESQGREIWPPAEMVEILMQENSSLKAELEACYQKVSKSQKVRN